MTDNDTPEKPPVAPEIAAVPFIPPLAPDDREQPPEEKNPPTWAREEG